VFQYLSQRIKPTEDSVRAMVDKELPELIARIKGDSLENDLKSLCQEIDENSSWLGKAVRAGGIALVASYRDSYPDVPEELWSAFQVWSAVAILAVLRLAERELEAEELAKQLKLS